jgi:putative selenium metabolism protein SsnA
MSHELLVGPVTVFTNTQENPVHTEAGVLCVGERISKVGPWSELVSNHGDAQRLQGENKLLLPGLINAHHHLYSTFSRGMPIPDGTPLGNFPEILDGIWWKLDRALDLEAVEAGAYPPVIDCMRWGTTTIVDHHASPNAILGSLQRLAKVCDEVGVRSSLCYEITDRNGLEGALEGIEESASYVEACKNTPRRSALLGFHASFTVSDETLAKAAARIAPDIPIHVHIAEDISDVTRSREQFGKGILERLEAHGLLRKNSVLVHGIHLDDEELDRIAQAEAWLVHNPESNANNAVGHLDVERALSRGVRVVLGTDGMASNMLRAAKSAYLMIRHARRDPTVGFNLPRKLLFENNVALARALFDEPKLGAIEPGAPADLCLVDYDPPTHLDANNFDGHLVFGITESPVLATVSEGKLRMVRGVMVDLDARDIQRRVLQAASQVWKRL